MLGRLISVYYVYYPLLLIYLIALIACAEGGTGQKDVILDQSLDTSPEIATDTSGNLYAKIIIDKTKGNAPLKVTLDAEVGGCPEEDSEYLWEIGEGTFYYKKTPGEVVFNSSGTHNIVLEYSCKSTGEKVTDSVQVLVLDSADLTFSQVTVVGPTELATGDTLTLKFSIYNKGDRIDTPFKVIIVLSKDEIYQSDKDIVVKELVIEKMDDGRYKEVFIPYPNLQISIPNDTKYGSYFIFVVADPENVVMESNEDNNIAEATSFITITKPKMKPDLIISPPDFSPGAKVYAGKALPYSITLTNQGEEVAKNFRYSVFASKDTELSPDDIKLTPDEQTFVFELKPGQSVTVSSSLFIPKNTPVGEYRAIAKVDVNNTVVESDENNNISISLWTFTVEIEEIKGFDLNLKSISVSPHDSYKDGSIKITAEISNPGNIATPPFSIAYYVILKDSNDPPACANTNYDILLGNAQGEPIPPNGMTTVTKVLTIKSGIGIKYDDYYWVSVIVDPAKVLDEIEETNNCKVDPKPLHIFKEASVDVSLSDLFVHPEIVQAGKEIKVSYSMTNKGSTSSGAFMNYIVLSEDMNISINEVTNKKDFVLGKIAIDNIEPSQVIERVEKLGVPLALPHDIGQYWVGVIGDAENNLKLDKNKNNQTLISSSPITVLGPQGGCYEDAFEPNNSINQATILEQQLTETLGLCGGEDYYGVEVPKGWSLVVLMKTSCPLFLEPRPWDLDLDILDPQGKLLDRADATGDLDKAGVFAVPEDGIYYIRVYPKNVGNQAHYSLNINVLGPQDGVELMPIHAKVAPDAIYPGGLISVGATIVNLGKQSAPPTKANISLLPEGGGVAKFLHSVDVPEIPGMSQIDIKTSVILPLNVVGGNYVILVTADAANQIQETDESNNTVNSGKIFIDETMICEDDKYEPNDDFDFATPLSTETKSYQGLSVCPDLPDIYRFELKQGEAFSVSVTYEYKADKGYVGLELYDGGKHAILDAILNSTNPVVGLPYIWKSGTYYLKVRVIPVGGKAGPYKYSLAINIGTPLPQDVCPFDPHEMNNSFEDASDIGCGVNNLTLCKKDRDFFKIILQKGQVLSLKLNHSKSELKASLFIDPKSQSIKNISGNGSLDYVATEDVVLYLVIEPKSATSGISDFKYSLTVDGVPGTDISLNKIEVFPEEVYQGEDVQITLNLENQCQEDAPQFYLQSYLSQNQILDLTDVPMAGFLVSNGLSAKSAETYMFKAMIPLETTPGKYYVIVMADPDEKVKESQEDNNTSSAIVSVVKLCINDTMESNNMPQEAKALTKGQYDLVICPYDLDWFKVDLPSNITLKVEAKILTEDSDIDIRLYKEPDTIKPVAISATLSKSEIIEYKVQQGGIYLIRVAGFFGSSAEYTLIIDY